MKPRILLAGAVALAFTGTAAADEYCVASNPTAEMRKTGVNFFSSR